MSVYSAIEAEVKAAMAATWTDVGTNSFVTQIQELSHNIIDEASRALGGDSTVRPAPFGIFGMGKLIPDYAFAAHGDYQRLPAKFWYVTTESGDISLTVQDWCESRMELLQAALGARTFLTFEVSGEDRGSIDSTAEVAFADESLTMYCAELSYEIGLLTLVTQP